MARRTHTVSPPIRSPRGIPLSKPPPWRHRRPSQSQALNPPPPAPNLNHPSPLQPSARSSHAYLPPCAKASPNAAPGTSLLTAPPSPAPTLSPRPHHASAKTSPTSASTTSPSLPSSSLSLSYPTLSLSSSSSASSPPGSSSTCSAPPISQSFSSDVPFRTAKP